MRIGIDFDNTIACYDQVFSELAISRGLIQAGFFGSKKELRDYLRLIDDGELEWQKLQGLVYGKYMHQASLFPGLAHFLLRLRAMKHEVFIVSHKTEFGHFDEDKTPLRQVAMDWMTALGFFDPSQFGVLPEHVFFNATREEKIAKIKDLGCDVFVDDLIEVFSGKDFPAHTQKILFSNAVMEKAIEAPYFASGSWSEISQHLLGEVSLLEIKTLASGILDQAITSIEAIPGRGNSKIFKLSDESTSYALKIYPDLALDPRERLVMESKACDLFKEHDINHVLIQVSSQTHLNMGIYKWIEGEPIIEPNQQDMDQAISFIHKLKSLSHLNHSSHTSHSNHLHHFPQASEACLSINQLMQQVAKRWGKLLAIKDCDEHFSQFLETELEPIFLKLIGREVPSELSIQQFSDLDLAYQILSPSDFGFHNSIKDAHHKLHWLDFEYFGWDDPVKLTLDFLWHPAMTLSEDQKHRWLNEMKSLFSKDPQFIKRLEYCWPLYGIRWSFILLNEFLNIGWKKRLHANTNELTSKKEKLQNQIQKSRNVLTQLVDANFSCPYLLTEYY